MQNLKLISIGRQGERTKIKVGSVVIGESFVVVGGPCGVESEEQTIRTAGAALLNRAPRPTIFRASGLKVKKNTGPGPLLPGQPRRERNCGQVIPHATGGS